MLNLEVFVVKFLAIDRLASRAVEVGEITSLDHEGLDNPVED